MESRRHWSFEDIGAASAPVEVVDYDPGWPRRFAREREALLAVLGSGRGSLEHGGSTSVPGLAAKPIVDILAIGFGLEAVRARLPDLEALGFLHYPVFESRMPGRLYLEKGSPTPGEVHLHVFEDGHPEPARMLRFRDLLRGDPELARRYGELKRELATRFRYRRFDYTREKTEFVLAALGGLG